MGQPQLYNVELESNYLSALVLSPELLAETSHITEKDFSDLNRKLFSAIKAIAASGQEYSSFLLADRLQSMGVKFGDVLDPVTYVNALELRGVNQKAALGIAKQLKNWTIRRELYQTAVAMVKLTEKDEQKPIGDLIGEVSKVFTEKVNLLSGGTENEPRDLYGSIQELLEAENVYDTNSVQSPWDRYNDFYGGFDAGQVYSICARAKSGKSTWVMSMLDQIMRQDDDFSALLMDTELTLEEVGFRLVSSLTGIKEYHIRHKHYKRRGKEEMRKKIEAAYKLINPFLGRVDHHYCGGMSWPEQESIIRRWVFKTKVKAKRRVMVVYDYLKYDGSDFDSKNGRDLVIGKKANGIKNLAKDLQIPIWALVQASRENEDTKTGGRISNGSVVADSDLISRLFSNIYLLQKLSDEQRAGLNQNLPTDATHALLPIYTRQLGPEESGLSGRVKYQDINPVTRKSMDRWCDNYICYSLHNFSVTEIATFRELYERAQASAGQAVQPTTEKPQGQLL